MKLDRELTSIRIEECAIDAPTYIDLTNQTDGPWTATLDGADMDGNSVVMDRAANSPDEALKRLFEGMSNAGVTL